MESKPNNEFIQSTEVTHVQSIQMKLEDLDELYNELNQFPDDSDLSHSTNFTSGLGLLMDMDNPNYFAQPPMLDGNETEEEHGMKHCNASYHLNELLNQSNIDDSMAEEDFMLKPSRKNSNSFDSIYSSITVPTSTYSDPLSSFYTKSFSNQNLSIQSRQLHENQFSRKSSDRPIPLSSSDINVRLNTTKSTFDGSPIFPIRSPTPSAQTLTHLAPLPTPENPLVKIVSPFNSTALFPSIGASPSALSFEVITHRPKVSGHRKSASLQNVWPGSNQERSSMYMQRSSLSPPTKHSVRPQSQSSFLTNDSGSFLNRSAFAKAGEGLTRAQDFVTSVGKDTRDGKFGSLREAVQGRRSSDDVGESVSEDKRLQIRDSIRLDVYSRGSMDTFRKPPLMKILGDSGLGKLRPIEEESDSLYGSLTRTLSLPRKSTVPEIVDTVVYSSYVLKRNRRGVFQKRFIISCNFRLIRCDGTLFVCMSATILKARTTLLEVDLLELNLKKLAVEIRLGYPSGSISSLANCLISKESGVSPSSSTCRYYLPKVNFMD